MVSRRELTQHAFKGHGFNASSDENLSCLVPGTRGPQTWVLSGSGIGGLPELMHILIPGRKRLGSQPFHPQVFLLKFPKSFLVSPNLASKQAHDSPRSVVCVAHVPSASGFGDESGSLPGEQHTFWHDLSFLQNKGVRLNTSMSWPEMPHFRASDGHPSPSTTVMYRHSAWASAAEKNVFEAT